jgi:hypothetical protein
MRLRLSLSFAVMVAALMLATPTEAAAAVAKLTGGTVTPTTGTTATVFDFSVHFVGTASDLAVTVTASVAGKTIPLTDTGTPRNGTWTGSSTLPVGSWTVKYRSTSTMGTDPTFTVPGQVVVAAPTPRPSPTTKPTPRPNPSPRPTPRPTSVPATPLPGGSVPALVSQTPFGTTVIDASTSPAASESSGGSASPASAIPSSSAPPGQSDSPPFTVPPEGVVAIGLLGAVTVAAALGERRRRIAVEAFRAAQPPTDGGPPPGEGPSGAAEQDAVDDETVATIDYDSPEEPEGPPRG